VRGPAAAAFQSILRAMPANEAMDDGRRCSNAIRSQMPACRESKIRNAQIVAMRRFAKRHSEQSVSVNTILEPTQRWCFESRHFKEPNMTERSDRVSAEIIPFPARGRFAATPLDETLVRAKVAMGSSWYHDEAIKEEQERKH
jgi:uncharacterized protein DUF2735